MRGETKQLDVVGTATREGCCFGLLAGGEGKRERDREGLRLRGFCWSIRWQHWELFWKREFSDILIFFIFQVDGSGYYDRQESATPLYSIPPLLLRHSHQKQQKPSTTKTNDQPSQPAIVRDIKLELGLFQSRWLLPADLATSIFSFSCSTPF